MAFGTAYDARVPLLTRFVIIAVLAYVVLVGVVWLLQERFIFYPQLGREIVATPATRGVPYEEVRLATSDGKQLNAWWVPVDKPLGTVLLFHGNAGNISHRIDYALMFRRIGYSTLLVDYRGYGRSTGTPTEQGTYTDADAAWGWLTKTQRVPEREVVLFGESLGGGVASWLAARHEVRAGPGVHVHVRSGSGFGALPIPASAVRQPASLRHDPPVT